MRDESRQSNMSLQETEWNALVRFVVSEEEPAGAAIAWQPSHPVDAAFVQVVKAHSERAVRTLATPIDVDAAFQRVLSRIGGEAAGPVIVAPEPVRLGVVRGAGPRRSAAHADRHTSRWWASRAVFAVAATAIAVVGIRGWRSREVPIGQEQVLATQVGQRDSVTLSDGTHVVLAPGSRLLVPADFARKRVVQLEGAASFNVHHDETRPFTVLAAQAEIRDVGTVFMVKTHATAGVSISVSEGVVALRHTGASSTSPVELRAGDRGVVREGTVAVSRGTVTADEMAWTRGQLSYRDATLAEVQADVKRWYGIHMIVTDSALTRLTITMPTQQNSAQVVRTIAALLGADAEQHGDTVILHSAARRPSP